MLQRPKEHQNLPLIFQTPSIIHDPTQLFHTTPFLFPVIQSPEQPIFNNTRVFPSANTHHQHHSSRITFSGETDPIISKHHPPSTFSILSCSEPFASTPGRTSWSAKAWRVFPLFTAHSGSRVSNFLHEFHRKSLSTGDLD
jgi:hypothetical protein